MEKTNRQQGTADNIRRLEDVEQTSAALYNVTKKGGRK